MRLGLPGRTKGKDAPGPLSLKLISAPAAPDRVAGRELEVSAAAQKSKRRCPLSEGSACQACPPEGAGMTARKEHP